MRREDLMKPDILSEIVSDCQWRGGVRSLTAYADHESYPRSGPIAEADRCKSFGPSLIPSTKTFLYHTEVMNIEWKLFRVLFYRPFVRFRSLALGQRRSCRRSYGCNPVRGDPRQHALSFRRFA